MLEKTMSSLIPPKKSPLVCKKCGHRLGIITLSRKYRAKYIIYAGLIIIGAELVAGIIERLLLG